MGQCSFRILQLFAQSIFVCLLGLLAVPQGSAQVVEPSDDALEALDQIISQNLDDNVIPGAVVAVIANGQLVHVKPYGLANVELSVPPTKETVFEIGSISKQFVTFPLAYD